MDIKQLLALVVRPTLIEIGLHSESAEQLVIGTICQESRGEYIKQIGGGPALGLAQMEPATHDDIWRNFLAYHPNLKPKVIGLISTNVRSDAFKSKLARTPFIPSSTELLTNLKYMVAMCRVHYLRVPHALPKPGDVDALAQYWKQFYNTVHGKGHASEFVDNYPGECFE